MNRLFAYAFVCMMIAGRAEALELAQHLKTNIGVFDACELDLSYAFTDGTDYDIKTEVKTAGAFGALYPFKASYRAYGKYGKNGFKPQNYYYETQSRFNLRTKEITYKNGVPQKRINFRGGKKTIRDIVTDPEYGSSADLLSVFAMLAEQIIRTGDCNFESYSFNGKKYSLSKVKKISSEKIQTEFFKGNADKCSYSLEIVDDPEAGFLINKDTPVYMWIMRDKLTNAPFIAKIEVPDTPFGEMRSVAVSVKVKK